MDYQIIEKAGIYQKKNIRHVEVSRETAQYDEQNAVRHNKQTDSSVYLKLLQRQSVAFMFQVFNEKTAAALILVKRN